MTPKTTIPRTTHQKVLNAAAALNRAAMKLNGSATLQSLRTTLEDIDGALSEAKKTRSEVIALIVVAERETRAHLEDMNVLRRAGV